MKVPRKPNPASVLKNLAEDRKTAILDYLTGHSLRETRAWASATLGLKTSETALSTFRSAELLQRALRLNETVVDQALEHFAAKYPHTPPEQLDDLGQWFFTARAIAEQDAKGWALIQRESRGNRLAKLEQDKFARETCALFLKWRSDQESNRIAELAVPNEEKIRLLRKHHFADVDALERTGRVQLPH